MRFPKFCIEINIFYRQTRLAVPWKNIILVKNILLNYKSNIKIKSNWSAGPLKLHPVLPKSATLLKSIFTHIFSFIFHIIWWEHRNMIHSCDYLNKISIKTNVATDEGNSWNEMWPWTNSEIGVAVQSWIWVRVELMAW